MRLQASVFLVFLVVCLGQPMNDKRQYDDVEKISSTEFIHGLAVNEKYVVIGYPDISSRGKVDVYENKPGYRFIKRLAPNELREGSFFGYSVAANNDYIVVGAAWDRGKHERQGAVYVFAIKENEWTYQRLEERFPGINNEFGIWVAINENNELVVGAWKSTARGSRTDSGVGLSAGATYIYALDSSGKWILKQIFKGLKAYDRFGSTVAITNDYLAVAADHGGSNKIDNMTGIVYVFKKASSGLWVEDTKLNSPNPRRNAFFGGVIAMHGKRIIIGSGDENDGDGNAYIFVLTNGNWTLESQLTGSPGGRRRFGRSVAIRNEVAVVGTMMHNGVFAQVFKLTNGKWERGKELNKPGEEFRYYPNVGLLNGKVYATAKDAVYVFTNAI